MGRCIHVIVYAMSSLTTMSIQIGKHSARVDGDTLYLSLYGDFLLEDLKPILQLAEGIIVEYGYYFALADISQLAAVPAETRHFGAQWARVHPMRGNVCYGGSLAVRTVLTLVLRAISVVSSSLAPLAFFKTEQESLAWIVAQRRKPA